MNLPEKVIKIVDSLSKDQLILLNRFIVERLKQMHEDQINEHMDEFEIGDTVCFENERKIINGIIIKINKKTISVLTENKERWNVTPTLLKRINHI